MYRETDTVSDDNDLNVETQGRAQRPWGRRHLLNRISKEKQKSTWPIGREQRVNDKVGQGQALAKRATVKPCRV